MKQTNVLCSLGLLATVAVTYSWLAPGHVIPSSSDVVPVVSKAEPDSGCLRCPPRPAVRDPFAPLSSPGEVFLSTHWGDADSVAIMRCCMECVRNLKGRSGRSLSVGGVPLNLLPGWKPARGGDWPDVQWMGLRISGDRAVVHLGLNQGCLAVQEWYLRRSGKTWMIEAQGPLASR